MSGWTSRRDPDFEVIGVDTELEEMIDARLRALRKDFDENGQEEWNDNWPDWAWANPHDEEFRTELEKEYDYGN